MYLESNYFEFDQKVLSTQLQFPLYNSNAYRVRTFELRRVWVKESFTRVCGLKGLESLFELRRESSYRFELWSLKELWMPICKPFWASKMLSSQQTRYTSVRYSYLTFLPFSFFLRPVAVKGKVKPRKDQPFFKRIRTMWNFRSTRKWTDYALWISSLDVEVGFPLDS